MPVEQPELVPCDGPGGVAGEAADLERVARTQSVARPQDRRRGVIDRSGQQSRTGAREDSDDEQEPLRVVHLEWT